MHKRDQLAGCREYRRSQQTGRLVGLYDAREAGFDDACGRWATVCESHHIVVNHPSLALARRHLADPLGWCEECMAEHGQRSA